MADKKISVIVSASTAAAVRKLKQFSSFVGSDLNRTIQNTASRLASLGKYAVAGGLIALTTGGTLAAKSVLELGINAEQTRISFQTMTGSVEKGNAVLAKLNKFANVTPFTNDEVVKAGKTLMSFGIQAESITDVLKMVGDTASGSGKDFNELASIFGKVQAKGKAQAEELNQLSEAGIPIVKTLAAMYGKTGEQIYEMGSKGQITSAVMTEAFRKMTGEGGVYYNMMQKQSETVAGRWSTIVGQLQLIGSEIGEALLPLLRTGAEVLQSWVDRFSEFNRSGGAIESLSAIGMTGVDTVAMLMKSFNTFMAYAKGIWDTLGRVGRFAFNSILLGATLALMGIVANTVDAVNMVIEALNKIPKIKLDKIDASGITDPLKIIAVSAVQEMNEDFNALAKGSDYTAALENAAQKNAAIDRQAAEWNAKIAGWQQKQLEIRRKLNTDEKSLADQKFTPGSVSSPVEAAKVAAVPKVAGMSVDRLTKMGLYHAGSGLNPKDDERNSLLKELIKAVRANKPERSLA